MANRRITRILLTCGMLLISVCMSTAKPRASTLECEKIDKQEDIKFETSYELLIDKFKELKATKEEKERLKAEEEQRIKEQQEIESKTKIFRLTFYTSSQNENGGDKPTASGVELGNYQLLANNTYKLGTIINLDGYGELKVLDRGSDIFDSNINLDVFIPREYGENYSHYIKRVHNMGVQHVKGYIVE